ncbi:MAG: lysophospholipid acyltransferase family protein [Pseudoruegeria sp.]
MRHQTSRNVRNISYSSSAATKGGRTVIRILENTTGRLGLINQARGYEDDIAQGRDFFEVMSDRYGVSLDVLGGKLGNIPSNGPLILVANHPYGILDGLMMGRMLAETRGDFRILANSVFQQSKDLNRVVLPVNFDGTKAGARENLETRKAALRFLGQSGAVGIFPGGTVSTSAKPFSQRPMDPGWRNFTAKMISRSGATVVPVFFDGYNSRLFQIASHLHQTLRLSLFIKEFKNRINTAVPVVIGEPIDRDKLSGFAQDPNAMMDFLRKATYELSPTPLRSYDYGHEFEDKYKG